MSNIISYNSWENKAPFGAIKINQGVRISVQVNEGYDLLNLKWVILKEDKIVGEVDLIRESKKYYQGEYNKFNETGLYFYYFEVDINIDGNNRKLFYGKSINDGSTCEYSYENLNKYQITVHEDFQIPSWYKEGVMYNIFVDRFNNGNRNKKPSNPKKNSFIYANWSDEPMYIKDKNGDVIRWDFHGGNLKGIIDKLPYLSKIGVSIIYLSPIFESSSNHKYNTGDYKKIDPMFGDEEIFKELCSEAEDLGMRIILDGVFSHTGSDSKYFNKFGNYDSLGAYQSLESPYYRWYRFNDYPKLYEAWWGFSNMPNVDELNPSYLDYIIRNNNSIIEKWLKLGASGWRLDVADELPDEFIKILKKKLKEVKAEGVLIGEVWEDASNKYSYNRRREYLFGSELDSVTNYPLRQIILDLVRNYIGNRYFIKKYMSLKENYPKEYFYSTMNILGNHDTERVLTILNNNISLLKLAVVIQMTLPGVPLIYYGDEAGLTGGKDPYNRKAYPWGKENKDILNFYTKISNIRASEEALKSGEIKFLDFNNEVLGYERLIGNEKIVVVVNTMEKKENISLYDVNDGNTVIDLMSNDKKYEVKNSQIEIELKSHEYKILKIL